MVTRAYVAGTGASDDGAGPRMVVAPTVFQFSAPIPKAICPACEHEAKTPQLPDHLFRVSPRTPDRCGYMLVPRDGPMPPTYCELSPAAHAPAAAWQELTLLREAIALAECNCCEDSLDDNGWVVVDYTEHYDPQTEKDLRPFWMCMQGIWSTERKALLCASCAASDTSATSPFRSAYRNHRGPGLRLLGPDLRLLERENE